LRARCRKENVVSKREEAIRRLAHRLWEERGRVDGFAEEDWLAAERQLNAQSAENAAGSLWEQGEAQEIDPTDIAGSPLAESGSMATPSNPGSAPAPVGTPIQRRADVSAPGTGAGARVRGTPAADSDTATAESAEPLAADPGRARKRRTASKPRGKATANGAGDAKRGHSRDDGPKGKGSNP
jgi:hypothetical protein